MAAVSASPSFRSAPEDVLWVERLVHVDALLRRGDAGAALRAAGTLFAEGPPASRLADLCGLTAESAQAVGHLELAERMWEQAALHAVRPAQSADAQANLGALLAGQKRLDEAEPFYRRALEQVADHAVALANLGLLLAATGRPDEAETCQRRAILSDPARAATHSNLGVLLAAQKRSEDAEVAFRDALQRAPDDASAHTNLGLLLQGLGRLDEAETHQRRALERAPGSAEIHSNLGNLLASRHHDEEAETLLRRAVALDPGWAPARTNLGVLLADQARDGEAEATFRAALALRPTDPLTRLNLGRLLLAQGRFAEGWDLHEARHDPALPDNGIAPPPVALPQWRGESLAGLALLVWPEQGLGDQIQFCRFVPRLKALGAARITLVCQRPLLALFETLAGVDRVYPADVVDNAFQVDPEALASHDLWTFPMSVPACLGTDLGTLPQVAPPYLAAPAAALARWRDRLPAVPGTLRVGLVWRGNPRHDNDADRSLPDLQTLAPLWQVPDVSVVSLQFGRAGLAAHDAPRHQPLLHVGDQIADFADTAGALEALDLLICVDTSIAHLAGALGRPCWVLLPRRKTDWRWLRSGEASPWYPVGMRLFRQTTPGDWGETVEHVRDALMAWAPARLSRPCHKPL
ncbi:MAG: tetratricopeptide repeat protein [Pseudomonadota bacterium]|nr:tetratricopeptide repeat protein [Pseudomonadota bacterium]